MSEGSGSHSPKFPSSSTPPIGGSPFRNPNAPDPRLSDKSRSSPTSSDNKKEETTTPDQRKSRGRSPPLTVAKEGEEIRARKVSPIREKLAKEGVIEDVVRMNPSPRPVDGEDDEKVEFTNVNDHHAYASYPSSIRYASPVAGAARASAAESEPKPADKKADTMQDKFFWISDEKLIYCKYRRTTDSSEAGSKSSNQFIYKRVPLHATSVGQELVDEEEYDDETPTLIGDNKQLGGKTLIEAHPEECAGVAQLSELPVASRPGLLMTLQTRYKGAAASGIYTSVGRVLIAVNPFCDVGEIYSEQIMQDYGRGLRKTEPHVFHIPQQAFGALFQEQQNQSIIIGGESGAGKTESTKLCLQYLSRQTRAVDEGAAKTKSSQVPLDLQVLQANVMLEAFGNAKTSRNSNSSRFGKWLKLFFVLQDSYPVLLGASVQQFLLEKLRVTNQADGERNYHIFYEIVKSSRLALTSRQGLGLFSPILCMDAMDLVTAELRKNKSRLKGKSADLRRELEHFLKHGHTSVGKVKDMMPSFTDHGKEAMMRLRMTLYTFCHYKLTEGVKLEVKKKGVGKEGMKSEQKGMVQSLKKMLKGNLYVEPVEKSGRDSIQSNVTTVTTAAAKKEVRRFNYLKSAHNKRGSFNKGRSPALNLTSAASMMGTTNANVGATAPGQTCPPIPEEGIEDEESPSRLDVNNTYYAKIGGSKTGDRSHFADLMCCFENLGFSTEALEDVMSIVVGVLWLGEVQFVAGGTTTNGGDNGDQPCSDAHHKHACEPELEETLELVSCLLGFYPKTNLKKLSGGSNEEDEKKTGGSSPRSGTPESTRKSRRSVGAPPEKRESGAEGPPRPEDESYFGPGDDVKREAKESPERRKSGRKSTTSREKETTSASEDPHAAVKKQNFASAMELWGAKTGTKQKQPATADGTTRTSVNSEAATPNSNDVPRRSRSAKESLEAHKNFRDLFFHRKLQTAGTVTYANNSLDQCATVRNAIAQTLYSQLFKFLVDCVNVSLRGSSGLILSDDKTPTLKEFERANMRKFRKEMKARMGGRTEGAENDHLQDPFDSFVGLLDIAGFESFAINGLEQLLINYTAEKMVSHFNGCIFEEEIGDYRRELGIIGDQKENTTDSNGYLPPDVEKSLKLLESFRFADNRAVMSLMEHAEFGLFAKIEEEIALPKGSDEQFLEKFRKQINEMRSSGGKKKMMESSKNKIFLEGSEHFKWDRKTHSNLQFGVQHFADLVTYQCTDFTVRAVNVAPSLENALNEVLGLSTNLMVRLGNDIGVQQAKAAKSGRPKKTIPTSHQSKLNSLVKELQDTSCHFIMCIKPNEKFSPWVYNRKTVHEQLKCLGLYSALEIRKQGFSLRMSFGDFFNRYFCVLGRGVRRMIGMQGRNMIETSEEAPLSTDGGKFVSSEVSYLPPAGLFDGSGLLPTVEFRKDVVALIKICVESLDQEILRNEEEDGTLQTSVSVGSNTDPDKPQLVIGLSKIMAIERARILLERERNKIAFKVATSIQKVFRGYMVRRELGSLQDIWGTVNTYLKQVKIGFKSQPKETVGKKSAIWYPWTGIGAVHHETAKGLFFQTEGKKPKTGKELAKDNKDEVQSSVAASDKTAASDNSTATDYWSTIFSTVNFSEAIASAATNATGMASNMGPESVLMTGGLDDADNMIDPATNANIDPNSLVLCGAQLNFIIYENSTDLKKDLDQAIELKSIMENLTFKMPNLRDVELIKHHLQSALELYQALEDTLVVSPLAGGGDMRGRGMQIYLVLQRARNSGLPAALGLVQRVVLRHSALTKQTPQLQTLRRLYREGVTCLYRTDYEARPEGLDRQVEQEVRALSLVNSTENTENNTSHTAGQTSPLSKTVSTKKLVVENGKATLRPELAALSEDGGTVALAERKAKAKNSAQQAVWIIESFQRRIQKLESDIGKTRREIQKLKLDQDSAWEPDLIKGFSLDGYMRKQNVKKRSNRRETTAGVSYCMGPDEDRSGRRVGMLAERLSLVQRDSQVLPPELEGAPGVEGTKLHRARHLEVYEDTPATPGACMAFLATRVVQDLQRRREQLGALRDSKKELAAEYEETGPRNTKDATMVTLMPMSSVGSKKKSDNPDRGLFGTQLGRLAALPPDSTLDRLTTGSNITGLQLVDDTKYCSSTSSDDGGASSQGSSDRDAVGEDVDEHGMKRRPRKKAPNQKIVVGTSPADNTGKDRTETTNRAAVAAAAEIWDAQAMFYSSGVSDSEDDATEFRNDDSDSDTEGFVRAPTPRGARKKRGKAAIPPREKRVEMLRKKLEESANEYDAEVMTRCLARLSEYHFVPVEAEHPSALKLLTKLQKGTFVKQKLELFRRSVDLAMQGTEALDKLANELKVKKRPLMERKKTDAIFGRRGEAVEKPNEGVANVEEAEEVTGSAFLKRLQNKGEAGADISGIGMSAEEKREWSKIKDKSLLLENARLGPELLAKRIHNLLKQGRILKLVLAPEEEQDFFNVIQNAFAAVHFPKLWGGVNLGGGGEEPERTGSVEHKDVEAAWYSKLPTGMFSIHPGTAGEGVLPEKRNLLEIDDDAKRYNMMELEIFGLQNIPNLRPHEDTAPFFFSTLLDDAIWKGIPWFLRHQSKPIKNSLLKFPNVKTLSGATWSHEQLNDFAVDMFRIILSYAGDRAPMSATKLIPDLFHDLSLFVEMVDEIWVQLIKQVTSNPMEKSEKQVWSLLMKLCEHNYYIDAHSGERVWTPSGWVRKEDEEVEGKRKAEDNSKDLMKSISVEEEERTPQEKAVDNTELEKELAQKVLIKKQFLPTKRLLIFIVNYLRRRIVFDNRAEEASRLLKSLKQAYSSMISEEQWLRQIREKEGIATTEAVKKTLSKQGLVTEVVEEKTVGTQKNKAGGDVVTTVSQKKPPPVGGVAPFISFDAETQAILQGHGGSGGREGTMGNNIDAEEYKTALVKGVTANGLTVVVETILKPGQTGVTLWEAPNKTKKAKEGGDEGEGEETQAGEDAAEEGQEGATQTAGFYFIPSGSPNYFKNEKLYEARKKLDEQQEQFMDQHDQAARENAEWRERMLDDHLFKFGTGGGAACGGDEVAGPSTGGLTSRSKSPPTAGERSVTGAWNPAFYPKLGVMSPRAGANTAETLAVAAPAADGNSDGAELVKTLRDLQMAADQQKNSSTIRAYDLQHSRLLRARKERKERRAGLKALQEVDEAGADGENNDGDNQPSSGENEAASPGDGWFAGWFGGTALPAAIPEDEELPDGLKPTEQDARDRALRDAKTLLDPDKLASLPHRRGAAAGGVGPLGFKKGVFKQKGSGASVLSSIKKGKKGGSVQGSTLGKKLTAGMFRSEIGSDTDSEDEEDTSSLAESSEISESSLGTAMMR